MGIIKYSALVESIQGKLNGSTLRMQSGTGIIQNKPYRNPVGMAGVGDLTNYFGNVKMVFWNVAYRQAIQYVAHNGNPFPQDVGTIRDAIHNFGFEDAANNGTDTVAIATALTPWYMAPWPFAYEVPYPFFLPLNTLWDVIIQSDGTNLKITLGGVSEWESRGFILDLSPPSSLVNYRLRQRVSTRIFAFFDPSAIYELTIAQSLLQVNIQPGEKVWASFTYVDGVDSPATGPRSEPRSFTVLSL